MKLPEWTNNNLIAGLVTTVILLVVLSLAGQIPWWATVLVISISILAISFLIFWPTIWGKTKDRLSKVWLPLIGLRNIFWHPLAQFLYFVVLLGGAILIPKVPLRYYLALGALFLYMSAQGFLQRKVFVSSTTLLFGDDFKTLGNWETITGNPVIEENFGNPSPDVLLNKNPNDRTNSFIANKRATNLRNGSIECDIYLEPGSLINIIFRANLDEEKYYMARLDSRDNYFGSILRLDGKTANWKEIAVASVRSEPRKWHHMKVIFKDDEIGLFKDDNLIASTKDSAYSQGSVGVFNEVESVHVDNFVVRKEL